METKILVPETLRVGYQSRTGTFTGKLAYVTYEYKGELRKAKSWNSWCDSSIPKDTYDNKPMTGFIINKSVGGHKSGWNYHKMYCRIYDPRGFEFEISIDNLMYILEYANVNSKVIDCELTYGWDGAELVLLPTNSPEYKEISEYTSKLLSSDNITAKMLVEGTIYETKKGERYLYLGKYDYYEYRNTEPFTGYNRDNVNPQSAKPRYWFYKYYGDTEFHECEWNVITRASITPKFLISVVGKAPKQIYNDAIKYIKTLASFSPLDYDSLSLSACDKQKFIDKVMKEYHSNYHYDYMMFCDKNGRNYLLVNVPKNEMIAKKYNGGEPFMFVARMNEEDVKKYGLSAISDDRRRGRYLENITTIYNNTPEGISEIYEEYKPNEVCIKLKNGEEYERIISFYLRVPHRE